MIKLVSVVVLLSIFILFIFQNASPTEVSFLVWEWQSSRAAMLIVVFLAGLTTGVLFMLYLGRNKRKSTSLPPIRYS